MLNGRNLVLDTMSEVYQLMLPWRTHEFWDFSSHDIIPNSIYIVGRKQFAENTNKIRQLTQRQDIRVIFDNSAEGSWTLASQLQAMNMDDLFLQHRALLISGGDMAKEYAHVRYDHFITCILDYEENLLAMKSIDDIFSKHQKPYQFLFLNGRARPHRKYIWEKLNQDGYLDHALWTMLDSRPTRSRTFRFLRGDIDVMATTTPLKNLPAEYEFPMYRNSKISPGPLERSFVKNELFKNTWGEIYLQPDPYIDTYFSLVTETVFDQPHSFRTEKIAKPLAMGHPWICAANSGFYQDLHDLGFKTFGHVLDESFDQIDSHQDRLDRIVSIVVDLCKQDLTSFLAACETVCKYNQQHLIEIGPRIRSQFPNKLFNLIDQYE